MKEIKEDMKLKYQKQTISYHALKFRYIEKWSLFSHYITTKQT